MTQSKDESTDRLPPEEDHLPPEVEHLPPELNSLISEEALGARIQKIMEAPPPKRWYTKILDHSLFAVVLGILLTFGLGTVLAQRWENSRLEATRQIEQERRQKDALIGAYNDFLGALSEQKARSLLVDHAIQLEAPLNELAVLLHNERETFAKSQQKAAVLSFTIRELVSPKVYERIHNGIENGLIEPLDGAMRAHAFIYSRLSSRPRADDWKNSAAAINRVSVCGTAVSHAVWYNTIAPNSADADFISRKEESMKRMEEDCKR